MSSRSGRSASRSRPPTTPGTAQSQDAVSVARSNTPCALNPHQAFLSIRSRLSHTVSEQTVVQLVWIPWDKSTRARSVHDATAASQGQAQRDHADAEHQVKKVVGSIYRNEIGRRPLTHNEAIDEQHQIDHTAPHQVIARPTHSASQQQTSNTKQQVHDVVQDRHLKNTEQKGLGMMRIDSQRAVVCGDTWNKAEHTDGEKNDSDRQRSLLDRCSTGTSGRWV